MSVRHLARHTTLETGSHLGERSELRSMKKSSSKKATWEIRLGVGQLLVTWAVISGIMVAVFSFGFNSGLKDGVERTLLSRSTSDMRLPIIGAEPPSSIAKKYSSIAQSDVAASPTTATARDVAAEIPRNMPVTEKAEPIQDAPATAVVGYSEKSAAAAIADTRGSKSEGSAILEKSNAIQRAISSKSAGWYVQVASTKDSKDSMAHLAKVEKLGLQAKVENAMLRGISFHQVLVGPYPQKEAALAAQEKLKASGSFSGRLFVKELK